MSLAHELTSSSSTGGRCRLVARRLLAPWLCAAGLGGATAALAQSPACDQFKDTVATRIPADALGTLETVPASTPLPPGAKVVGTCDGGAFKILHYRRGVTPPVAGAASAATAASAVSAAPRVAVRASAPAASTPSPSRAEPAKPPEPVKPVAVKPVPVKPPEPAASPVAMPPAVAPAVPAVADTRDEPLMRDPPPLPPEGPGLIATTTDALVEHWPWTLAALLLPLLAWAWSWFSHRQVYDAAGLPRGPKL
ncbi:DUF1161 domain-containing protein [Rhizobacter sp. SG703]|uniref:DUF1161 domain-containing protein n=1 Tax=Rhizobacter sp. SG703 TaxID=2587140 RepID=UPI001447967F|nr:DUF1161 domain-containing protein [Rhizobacter sp. SG703]NKI97706.1 hypothetical protein [Rhizobacter sp. SG703]